MSHPGNDNIIDNERDKMETPNNEPTVDEKRKPFCRAIETTGLIEELKKYREGEEVPYDALTKAAMGNCAPGKIKYPFLKSARDILFKEDGVEFKAIPNVGLVRMSSKDKLANAKFAKVKLANATVANVKLAKDKLANDKLDKAKRTLPSYNRKAKKDMHRLQHTDFDSLNPDEQLCHSVHLSILNVLRCSTSGDRVNKVSKVIANNEQPERLALEETLKTFL